MLLGDIHFEMRNLPQAGRYWLLTPAQGDSFQAAINAFHEKYGRSPDDILRALPIRTSIEEYPPAVQERIRGLVSRAKSKKWGAWDSRGIKARRILRRHENIWRDRFQEWVRVPLAILTIFGIWLYGLFNLVGKLIDWLR